MGSTLPQVYVVDGGLGTTLADQYCCVFNETTPLWSSQLLLTDPTTLLEAQTAFAHAGADVILSATYQSSFEGFARSGVAAQDALVAMRRAVSIARQAFRGREPGKVALSLGAYGAVMVPSQEYSGAYDEDHATRDQLREWHQRRLQVFSEEEECWGSVDLVAFETLPLLNEVLAAREVMDRLQKNFWICCVFPGPGKVLPDGSSVRDVVRAMLGKREGARTPMGVGINCTKMVKVEGLIVEYENAVKELVDTREVLEWPSLVVYPDGTNGEVYNTTTRMWEKVKENENDFVSWDETLMDIVDRARLRGQWKSIFVGGCCKTTPGDISRLSKRRD